MGLLGRYSGTALMDRVVGIIDRSGIIGLATFYVSKIHVHIGDLLMEKLYIKTYIDIGRKGYYKNV